MKTEVEARRALAETLGAYYAACRECDRLRTVSPFSPDGEIDETALFHAEQSARFAWERAQALEWVLEMGSVEARRQMVQAREAER